MQSVHLQTASADAPLRVDVERMDGRESHMYTVRLGERQLEVELLEQSGGYGCLRIHNQVVPYFVRRKDRALQVWMAGDVFALEIVDQTARRSSDAEVAHAREQLVAPMPGTILKVNIEVGTCFEAHQPLIIMESMKMETTLSMPHAGRVVEINLKAGELVEMGAVLARVESIDEMAAS